eukprot:7984-Lingulodinium_polyedra.AAC.1
MFWRQVRQVLYPDEDWATLSPSQKQRRDWRVKEALKGNLVAFNRNFVIIREEVNCRACPS